MDEEDLTEVAWYSEEKQKCSFLDSKQVVYSTKKTTSQKLLVWIVMYFVVVTSRSTLKVFVLWFFLDKLNLESRP
jgi:hypothetical protein